MKTINKRHNSIQNNKESPVTCCYFHCVFLIKDGAIMRLHDSRSRKVCHCTVMITM